MKKPFIPAGTMLILKHYDIMFVALEDSVELTNVPERPGEVCYQIKLYNTKAHKFIIYTDTRKWFLKKFKIFWPEDVVE